MTSKVNEENIDLEINPQTNPQTTQIIPVSKADDFLPALTLDQATERYDLFQKFVKRQMKDGTDYGTIPGTAKPSLLLPGAEKLQTFFGMTTKMIDENIIEDFDKPLFFYRKKCQVWRGNTLIAEASGSCNSMEDRYAWRWVQPHEVERLGLNKEGLEKKITTEGQWGWAYEKRDTSGKYGKPESYWEKFDQAIATNTIKRSNKVQHWNGKTDVYLEIETVAYRVPNEQIFTLVNTILKMAEKRAYVAAIKQATNASEYYTQDMEDIIDSSWDVDGEIIDITPTETASPPPPAKKKAEKSNGDDLTALIHDAVSKATAGNFPPGEYSDFAKALGYSKQQTQILNDNERNFNHAVLNIVKLHEGDQDFKPPVDEMPF